MSLYLNGRAVFSYRPSRWQRFKNWTLGRGWTLSTWAATSSGKVVVDEAAVFPVVHDEETEIAYWRLGAVPE